MIGSACAAVGCEPSANNTKDDFGYLALTQDNHRWGNSLCGFQCACQQKCQRVRIQVYIIRMAVCQ